MAGRSWPSRAARVTAADPNRRRTSSRAASSVVPLCWSKGRASCTAAVVVQVSDGQSDQRAALVFDHRHGGTKQSGRGREDRRRVGRGLRQRMRPRHPGEVVEAQPQHDGAAHPSRRAHPPGHPVGEPGQNGGELVGAAPATPEGVLGADRPTATARPAPGEDRGCGPGRAGGGRRPVRASSPGPPRGPSPRHRRS